MNARVMTWMPHSVGATRAADSTTIACERVSARSVHPRVASVGPWVRRRPRRVASGEDAAAGARRLCVLPVPAMRACRRRRRPRPPADAARPAAARRPASAKMHQLRHFRPDGSGGFAPRVASLSIEPAPWHVESVLCCFGLPHPAPGSSMPWSVPLGLLRPSCGPSSVPGITPIESTSYGLCGVRDYAELLRVPLAQVSVEPMICVS